MPSNKPPQPSVSGGYDDFMWKQDVLMTKTPYFSIAPPQKKNKKTGFLSRSFLSVCVHGLHECEGLVTACFPLSYHSCSTHTLHPVGLPVNERERVRKEKVRKKGRK